MMSLLSSALSGLSRFQLALVTAPLVFLGPCFPRSEPASVFASPEFGFELAVPADWYSAVESQSETSLVLGLLPRDGRKMKLKLSVGPGAEGFAAETLATSLTVLTEGDYPETLAVTATFGERELEGFELEAEGEGELWWLRRAFLEHEGYLFTLENLTSAEQQAELAPALEALWYGLELRPLEAEAAAARAAASLGERCGSEVEWAANWEEAAERARETDRLVLVTAHVYPGFAIPDGSMQTTFMDPDIVALVNARYVPLKLDGRRAVPFADHELYGLAPTTFGKAVLLVTPAGEVVDERIEASYDWLRASAAEFGSGPWNEAEAPKQDLARVQAHLDRGEHEQARELLRGGRSAEVRRVEADLLRRELRGEEALAKLALASEILEREREQELSSDTSGSVTAHDSQLAADLDLDTAWILMGLGQTTEALALASAETQLAPKRLRRAEALFLTGALERAEGRVDDAAAALTELISAHPEERWAWQAAGVLHGPYWELDLPWKLAWPAEDLRARFEPEPYAPRRVSEAPEVRKEALAWLLENQRPNGEWLVPVQLDRDDGEPPNDFVLATQAFCVQALLRARGEPQADAALAKALEALQSGYRAAHADGGDVYYMDYGVWSRSCLIQALVDAWEAGELERELLEELVPMAIEELAAKQIRGTGWSYYVTAELGNGATNATQPISFTTAAVVLALQRARGAGVEVPDELLDGGLQQLVRMRGTGTGATTFQYMTSADGRATPPSAEDPGAAGRAPLCMLALYRGGLADASDLARALDTYAAHAHTLTKEAGKGLMHTGPEAQGSHYVLFDHYWAAEAARELPESERATYRVVILDELLQLVTPAGYFYDNASDGFAWGTAAAARVIDRVAQSR